MAKGQQPIFWHPDGLPVVEAVGILYADNGTSVQTGAAAAVGEDALEVRLSQ